VVACPELTANLIQHPHREWESLNDEERAVKSKKNFDLFYTRWHHGQSLLVVNYEPGNRWFGHDHPRHVEGDHTHTPAELPPPGVAHNHKHQHWADHDHEHPHYHQ
jgi:cysteinyl-tRNA synthetase